MCLVTGHCVLASVLGAVLSSAQPAVAFFYGAPVPVEELGRFDWVVVQPDNLAPGDLERLQRANVEVFAYLSLGEAAPGTVEPGWSLGRNEAWGTEIMDPGAEGWQLQVLQRVEVLRRRGYTGLFLDTLDSYALALEPGEAREAARARLAGLVRAIHGRHPELKLFFNRGFEILDEVGALAHGLAAESVFFGWDAASASYVEVPAADREWLLDQLRRFTTQLQIPAVAVDYLPQSRRPEAVEAARRIQALGLVPWISTPGLDAIGVGGEVPAARRVLLLHDGAELPDGEPSPVLAMVAERLRSLGWSVESLDVRHGLPPALSGRFAGAVTWFTDDELPGSLQYPQWLARQVEAGIRVAILGRPGFPAPRRLLARLGLSAAPVGPAARVVRIARRDGLIGLEADPVPRSRGLVRWRAVGPDVTVHLRVEDGQGQPIDPVVTAPWGGLALQPYLLETGYQGRLLWLIDPAAFLLTALGSPGGGGDP
jgi:hypothetical protein